MRASSIPALRILTWLLAAAPAVFAAPGAFLRSAYASTVITILLFRRIQ